MAKQALLTLLSGLSSNELAYGEFKQLVKIDKVKDIVLSEHRVWCAVVADGLSAVVEAPRVARFGCKQACHASSTPCV
ncbi:hypothetical protein [Pseudoduganella sp. OTU4001]|uniref:hypothetical protein n=1 Tax=Pseudoduganella sp. OTU4001 TaxID=3043854 RepID=UPI00313E488B